MSSGSLDKRAELFREIVRELRQHNGLGASFFRAAAGRTGMTDTDMQVIDILDNTGPTTAGQLAELTGLTTGAIAGMLNRLEEAGRVHRERDPKDGRKVIVRLVKDTDDMRKVSSIFDSLGKSWAEMAAPYDDEQLALLLEFLKRANTISTQEIAQLRAAPPGEEAIFSAPRDDVTSGQLVVSGALQLTMRADDTDTSARLYQASFQGPAPDVKVKGGVVTIRYPRRLPILGGRQRIAEVTLNADIPWRIIIKGAASEINAALGGLDLVGLEVNGGMSLIRLELPAPSGEIPIRISGGASAISVRRPAGVAARAHLKGWVSQFVFDDQTFGDVGNDVRRQSPGYDATSQRYDIEVSSSASVVSITSA